VVENGGIATAAADRGNGALAQADTGEPADPLASEEPPLDPDAIERAYWHHRARRHARIAHRRETRRAGARFWLVMLVLAAVSIALAVFIVQQVQHLFGI
jgi:hypothetical protein